MHIMSSETETCALTESATTHDNSLTPLVGQVKWFDKVKGFGFISNIDDQVDYFVHHTQISSTVNDDDQRELFRYLIAGEYVEFQLQNVSRADEHGDRKVMACKVTGIRGGSLMYNIIHQQHQERNAFHREKYGTDGQLMDVENGGEALDSGSMAASMMDDDGFTEVRKKKVRRPIQLSHGMD